jgi:murein DD-endopeptidase MepM/ murein hydrolase activator NlpD
MRSKFDFYLNIFLFISVPILFTSCKKDEQKSNVKEPKPNQFGLAVNDLIEVRDTIQIKQTLSEILIPHGVSQKKINEIEKAAKDVFPLKKFRADDELYIYAKWDSVETVKYFVYTFLKDPINYFVFDLRDTISVYKKQRPFTIKQVTVNGYINENLYKSLADKGVKKEVGDEVADIYESQIDFGLLQEKDSFTIVFEQIDVLDQPATIGKILAAKINYGKKDYFAFRFEKEKGGKYYDERGYGLQGMFLTAPIKFKYRITSRYSSNRYHPILHTNKAHLGTDYAAPAGTQIMTVANGVVLETGYSSGNGNYVKVKHNRIFTYVPFCQGNSIRCTCYSRADNWFCRKHWFSNRSARLFQILEKWKTGESVERKE